MERILAARKVLKITWVCLLLACLAVALLVSIIAISFASEYPGSLRHFPLSWVFYPYEPLFLGSTAVMVPAVLLYAWSEVRDLSQPYRDGLNEMATDDLVGALYQRAASNRRNMAYGICAILHKFGASSLPEPTYDADAETEIPLVYRQLTVNLLEVTGNLRILYIAAARRLQDTAPWVPDWSTYKSNAWRDLPGSPGIDQLSMHRGIPFEMKEIMEKERALQRVTIHPTHGILTVLAENTGAICGCISFRSRGKTLSDSDKDSHSENMRGMLQQADWAGELGCSVAAISYTPPVPELAHEVSPLSPGAAWPSRKARDQWACLLAAPMRDKLNLYLTRWMDGMEVPRWFSKFMTTQICLCTLIAELKRKVCYVSVSAKPGNFRLLACSEETQVDDRVIRVCGLLSSIVMCKRGELGNSVTIISPTQFQGRAAFGEPKSTNKDRGTILEDRFVEYHIH
ncbi:hypothetical protein AG0111_0g7193 [Alternaria gaisen]|uniref:Uncharacterized protein n=1 Tax=Alternaria gaisen TaxID=167740 RepID=A0ACB6FKL8_9PLEO|nr:hypothetical protein AG0111_0g7193 [Alternaria gaisen]